MPASLRPTLNRGLVVLVVFTLLIGSACSFTQALVSQNEKQVEVDVSVDETEVRFLEEDFESPRYVAERLGSISFQADTSAGTAREVTPADGHAEQCADR